MFANLFSRFIDMIADRLLDRVVDRMDRDQVAERTAYLVTKDDVVSVLAKKLHMGHLAEAVCDTLDHNDFARKVAESFSASDFAQHLDLEDIAQHVEVDYYDLAGRMEASEVASHLDLTDIAREIEIDVDEVTVDYEALAKALLSQIAKSKPVEVRSGK